jgi:uncharacterized protein (TIRG00374 family)
VVYLLLPRLGGLRRDAQALRRANWWLMGVGVGAEAVSLFAYVLLYRRVLSAMGYSVRLLPVAEVTMASFLVSHLVPGGSATGSAVNVRTMHEQGVPVSSTSVAVVLTTLLSDVTLLGVFVSGLAYSLVKRRLPVAYVIVASAAIPILAAAVVLAVAAISRPRLAEGLGRAVGRMGHRVRSTIDPDGVGRAARQLSLQARKVLARRTLVQAFGLAALNWLADIFVLYLFFLAVGHHQHFGALMVAYSLANMIAAIPITPGGLGVIEATLVALSIPFGAPRAIAVVAVIGYRLVNFWLPLPFGLAAYVDLRLRPGRGASRKDAGKPAP